jgi:enamine deaminase RidA (YjgF/YER057c/UK114 family)
MTPRQFISSGSPYEELAGYSRAVAQGDWVFVSGTVGFNRKTGRFAAEAAAQAEQAFDTIETALKEAKATLMDVVRVRVYIPDPADVPAVSAVVKRRVGAARAANTTICSPLPVAEAKVEIEVTALRRGA